MTEKNWSDLTRDEKREERFKGWLSPAGATFVSPASAEAYRKKVTRLIDTIQLREPDRVPVYLPAATFPAHYSGITLKSAMYDYQQIVTVWSKFIQDFDLDVDAGVRILPGRVYDMVDYKQYMWPGHGIPADASEMQYVEGEYMRADEYDALIRDPSDFFNRVIMPRIFGAFKPFHKLAPATGMLELLLGYLSPYADQDVQGALQVLIDVGKEFSKWKSAISQCSRMTLAAGIPAMPWVGHRAPFDRLGDTLRGTRGVMMDIYRQPEKLLRAMDILAELTIEEAVSSLNKSKGVMVNFPLHKGADGFMSQKQFETFYWPTLKKIMLALIEEGITISIFAEGSFDTRLETIAELPPGWVTWRFDRTDMARAKAILGPRACIGGNVPTSLLHTGTPQQVKDHCRMLIEICAPGGGYILSPGAGVGKVNPQNLQAMLEAAKEYGVYS
ncbi:MAG: hypothetical protein HYX90_02885 [Chloroflexi bacterium]|nr:hypothetical protein [Chloroflexota bacterium]